MNISLFPSTLELLPDEILLEICRYLHSGDVLYSFYDLNSRFNQTITFYCQHVSLHRTFYMQFIHIFTIILPQIGSSIRSLVIFELESPLFLTSFKTNSIYHQLEKLTLVNWTDEKLILFLETLHGMTNFHQLIIQALDLTESMNNLILLRKILGVNDNRLTHVSFDHECDALSLSEDEDCPVNFPNLVQLDIELQTTKDICHLGKIIPNIEQLHVTFKRPWTQICHDPQRFVCLKEFHVYAMSWFSTFDDLKTLIHISSIIENISLILVTHDHSMVNGERVLSLLPSSIQRFDYSICYQPFDLNVEFDPLNIIQSWNSIPIIYSICQNDKRIFLHTIVYQSNRLSLRSLFSRNISSEMNNQIYRNVRHIHIYDTVTLTEIFGIIRHCRQILDLIVSIRMLPSSKDFLLFHHLINSRLGNQDQSTIPVALPRLNRLDFLSIQGSPPDSHYIEKILSSAPNLSALSIDFDCLYQLLIDEDQSLLLFYLLSRRIIILCIRFENTSTKELTNEHIHCLSRIFSQVNHLCFDLRNSQIKIESLTISLILNSFPRLMVLSMYGQLSEEMNLNRETIRHSLVAQSTGRLTSIDRFKIDYGNERVKVWM